MADCKCRICAGQPGKRRLVEVDERPRMPRGSECLACGAELDGEGFFCSMTCRDRHYGGGDRHG